MTIGEMKKRKIELGLTNEMIARETGLPLGTVQKIFSGETRAPRRKTIDALEQLLGEDRDGGSPRSPYAGLSYEAHRADLLREPEVPYGPAKKRGLHTIDDYYALPEDVRVELIDGVFYDMGTPSKRHQGILGELYLLFRECADGHGMPCEIWLSPCDVQLDGDAFTMLQPDLFVICGEHDPKAARFVGAPDLVVEILSPSSGARDKYKKLCKYHDAGVREYWIVDPDRKKVTVYLFEEDGEPCVYGFSDRIPVGISGGACEIDFSRVMLRMAKYL